MIIIVIFLQDAIFPQWLLRTVLSEPLNQKPGVQDLVI